MTIPKDVRLMQSIKVGDTVLFALEGQKVDFMKVERDKLLESVAGIWKDEIKGNSVDYVKEMRRGWARRMKRLGL